VTSTASRDVNKPRARAKRNSETQTSYRLQLTARRPPVTCAVL